MQFDKVTAKLNSRTKRLIKVYARMMITGEYDYRILRNVYDKTLDMQYAEVRIKKIIRKNQDMLTEEIVKLYEQAKITPKSVIKEEKALLKLAKEENQLSVAEKIISKWGKRTQLDGQETKTTMQVKGSIDYSKYLLPEKDEIPANYKQIESDNKAQSNQEPA